MSLELGGASGPITARADKCAGGGTARAQGVAMKSGCLDLLGAFKVWRKKPHAPSQGQDASAHI